MTERRDPTTSPYYESARRTAQMLVHDGLLLDARSDHDVAVDLITRGLLDAWETGVHEGAAKGLEALKSAAGR